MFKTYLQKEQVRPLIMVRNAVASISAHALVFAVVIYLSARAVTAGEEEPPIVTFVQAAPPPPPPPPAAAPKKSTKRNVIPKKTPPKMEEKPPPPPEKPVPEEPPDFGGKDDGVEGGVEGGMPGGEPVRRPSNVVIPFGPGMTRPAVIAGPTQPKATTAAVRANTNGLVLVECNISLQGVPTNCVIKKGLENGMGEAVLAMVRSQRFKPAMFQGRPQAVRITFPYRVKMKR
jgi:protein TonB